MKRLYLPLTQL